jgi:desulfoferrodoxin (superoxide reductase-like protein)
MVAGARMRFALVASLFFLVVSATTAFADKSSVTISAPESVVKGTEVTIKIQVTHSGNNFIHHVDWAKIGIDGKEVARWNFTWNKRAESKVFEREFKYVVNAPVEISAEANCNLHGSKGLAKASIKVTE